MSAWMLYALVIGSLLWLAGHCAERLVLAAGRGTRWIWLAGIAASTAVPLLLPVWNARYGAGPADAGGVAGIGEIRVIGGIGADVPAEVPFLWLERALAIGWGAASVALLAFFMSSAIVLRRRRRRWPLRVIAGMPVLVSERTGPALVGFAAPDIVVPSWVLDWDDRSLRLLVAHEREHDRAGDPLLLLASAAALVLLPWNLPLWWQVRRLRLAIEVDCDARVLRRHPDARQYGLLLLEVGALASRGAVSVAAFSEPSSLLERRMRVLSGARRIRRPTAVLFASAALAGPAAVAALPVPEAPAVPAASAVPVPVPLARAGEPVAQPEEADRAAALDTIPDPDHPGVVPYDTAPGLLPEARERLAAALAREYPPQLRDAGVGGTVTVWMFVDAAGSVTEARVASGSGHPPLDSAAMRVARDLEFTPARRGGSAVPVWIQLPVQFSAGAGAPRAAPDQPHRVPVYTSPPGGRFGRDAAPDTAGPAGDPTFTPYEVRPALQNRAEFARILESSFPPMLKDAGVSATATFWVYIREDGQVESVRLVRSSGYEQLDQSGSDVLLQAEFSPALNRGRPVSVWIQLPVTFQSRER